MPKVIRMYLLLILISAVPYTRAQECQIEGYILFCENITDAFTQLTMDSDYEEYIDYGTDFQCINCQLKIFTNTTFPFGGSGSCFESFDVSNSGIESIVGRSFTNLIHLKYLYLNKNGIQEIHPDAFCDLYLEELHLERNNLKKIDPHWFKQMSSVAVDVSYNALTALNNRDFIFAKALKKLNLSKNNISTLHPHCFLELDQLEILNLSSNSISFLQNGMFVGKQSLLHLDLSYNRISVLEYGLLSGLKNLKTLFIFQNCFNNFNSGPLLSTSSLHTLGIDGNVDEFNPMQIILNVPTLKELIIEDFIVTCKQLEDVLRLFRRMNIFITTPSLSFGGQNIDGIPCITSDIPFHNRRQRWHEFVFRTKADAGMLKCD